MEITGRTRKGVYTAAASCQSSRTQVVLNTPLDGPRAIEAAFKEWRDEWGQDPRVKLSFRGENAVFDYIDD